MAHFSFHVCEEPISISEKYLLLFDVRFFEKESRPRTKWFFFSKQVIADASRGLNNKVLA